MYTDGSRLDGPSAVTARNGWAFVVIDDEGTMIAAAYGVPPGWITDIPGTEAWALYQAASLAEPGCEYFVDCEPAVKAMHQGPAACARDNNPLARVHGLMHHALSDVPPQAVIWMPSHVKPGQCGTITRGDGFLLEETDVEANEAADILAKRAVGEHRVPYRTRKAIEAHDALTASNAMWVARATILANQQQSDPVRDTRASSYFIMHFGLLSAGPLTPDRGSSLADLVWSLATPPRQ